MTRKLLILMMLFATTLLVLPLDSFAQWRDRDRSYREYTYNQDRWEGSRRYRRSWRNRNRAYYGYRNYGQYRRTQVGNRRYRWMNRYYWNNGYRTTRRIRVFY